jgi:hypothetical protein
MNYIQIGSVLATSDTRATNLQTQAITPDIMSQDLTRLEKTMEATNKKQS